MKVVGNERSPDWPKLGPSIGQLTGYVFIDLKGSNYGGFVDEATRRLQSQITIPGNYGYKWSGEYEFELRAKQRLKLILPVVFFMILM